MSGQVAERSSALRRPAGSTLRLGTRGSKLAVAQSGWVARQVRSLARREVTTVQIATLGDLSAAPIEQLGGTGVFVTALRDALLRGEVDFVVHSLKDLPTAEVPGLTIAAVPPREDPRDALIWPGGGTLRDLSPGSRVGTSSARRSVELARLGLSLDVVPLRGNIDSRLRKLAGGEIDALVLATAGLARLGLTDSIAEVIDPALMLPAPAQGALAVECRCADVELVELLTGLDDYDARIAVTAERAFLAELNAGCTAPVGAYAQLLPGSRTELLLEGLTASGNPWRGVRSYLTGPAAEAERLGRELARETDR